MSRGRSKNRVLFDLNHPADFHLFRKLISELEAGGYELRLVARDKDCLHELLRDAGLPFVSRGKGRRSMPGKYLYAIRILLQLNLQLLLFRPRLCISLSSPYLVLSSRLLGIACLTYDDTDLNPRLLPLWKLSSFLITPLAYPLLKKRGHFRLPVLKEMTYLSGFEQPAKRRGLFVRLTRTDSIHHSPASRLELSRLKTQLGSMAENLELVLSDETGLLSTIEGNTRRARITRVHQDLAGCRVFWGNSPTMAAEAALLGLPAILVAAEKFAYVRDLEQRGLLHHFKPTELEASLQKVHELLSPEAGRQHQQARAMILKESLDLTPVFASFVSDPEKAARALQPGAVDN